MKIRYLIQYSLLTEERAEKLMDALSIHPSEESEMVMLLNYANDGWDDKNIIRLIKKERTQ